MTLASDALEQNPAGLDQADVTLWGIVALFACGLAVLSTSVSAILPPGTLTGLHAARLDSGNMNALRTEIGDLRLQTTQLRRQNYEMLSRLSIAERSRGDMTRRVGALEHTIPTLLEALPPGVAVDTSMLTSSIGTPSGKDAAVAVDGGSVRVTHHPLFEQPGPASSTNSTKSAAIAQPMPPRPAGVDRATGSALASAAFAIAIGPEVSADKVRAQWQSLNDKIGTLLLGFDPLYSTRAGNGQNHIVVGPIPDRAQADELCARMKPVGVACVPVKYDGRPI